MRYDFFPYLGLHRLPQLVAEPEDGFEALWVDADFDPSRGEGIASVAVLPALFLAYLQRWHAGQIPYTYQDQAMDPAVAHAICEAADPVAAFAADRVLWGDLAGDARLVKALREAAAQVAQFVASHPGASARGASAQQ